MRFHVAWRPRGTTGYDRPGRWVAFLDDDDYWGPLKLRAQLDALAEDDRAHFVWGTGVLVSSSGCMIDVMRTEESAGPSIILFERNRIGSPSSVMAQADLVRRVGGFDERLQVLADWDLWIRLASEARGVPCH